MQNLGVTNNKDFGMLWYFWLGMVNSHELSNAFNDHFSTTGTKLANEVPLVT